MKHCVSEIFDERPKRWGLRGDPFLWERLNTALDIFAEIYYNVMGKIIARGVTAFEPHLRADRR